MKKNEAINIKKTNYLLSKLVLCEEDLIAKTKENPFDAFDWGTEISSVFDTKFYINKCLAVLDPYDYESIIIKYGIKFFEDKFKVDPRIDNIRRMSDHDDYQKKIDTSKFIDSKDIVKSEEEIFFDKEYNLEQQELKKINHERSMKHTYNEVYNTSSIKKFIIEKFFSYEYLPILFRYGGQVSLPGVITCWSAEMNNLIPLGNIDHVSCRDEPPHVLTNLDDKNVIASLLYCCTKMLKDKKIDKNLLVSDKNYFNEVSGSNEYYLEFIKSSPWNIQLKNTSETLNKLKFPKSKIRRAISDISTRTHLKSLPKSNVPSDSKYVAVVKTVANGTKYDINIDKVASATYRNERILMALLFIDIVDSELLRSLKIETIADLLFDNKFHSFDLKKELLEYDNEKCIYKEKNPENYHVVYREQRELFIINILSPKLKLLNIPSSSLEATR